MEPRPVLYGLLAEFESPNALLEATRQAVQEGYREIEAYSPFEVEGLAELLGTRGSRLPLVILGGAIAGALGGYLLQAYSAVIDYPLNVGGRPLHSWSAFIPVTFELAILVAALAAVLGMLALNGLPQPYHPVFNVPSFEQASRNRFFLCVEARDARFDLQETRRFLEGLGAIEVSEVEP